MAISNPQGGQKFWSMGLPFEWLNKSGNNCGGQKFWSMGLPDGYLFPSEAVTSNIKTINGLAKANIKTINGLAIANVKTFNGLA